jgi:hypothetical protein
MSQRIYKRLSHLYNLENNRVCPIKKTLRWAHNQSGLTTFFFFIYLFDMFRILYLYVKGWKSSTKMFLSDGGFSRTIFSFVSFCDYVRLAANLISWQTRTELVDPLSLFTWCSIHTIVWPYHVFLCVYTSTYIKFVVSVYSFLVIISRNLKINK